jgi:hypothetical protein
MPQNSYFSGVIIWMFYRDHNPPQFHAFYGDYQALIDIQKNEILSGTLPSHILGIVVEWAALHQLELLENREKAMRQEELLAIAPLV